VADLDFEQIVNMHYAPLYRFALSLARDEEQAADLVQQTFYLWATRGHQLRDAAKLKPWLLTTLHREFLGGRRHENRFPHFEVGDVAHELPNVKPEMVDHMDGRAVMEALRQVDELYRAPLALFYLEDMSYKEIAETLDVPTGTVMSRLARGKGQLRELLCVDSDERRQKLISLRAAVAEGKDHHG
jgi:RNA polymerase sigma-70 factor (ECF subfamily)